MVWNVKDPLSQQIFVANCYPFNFLFLIDLVEQDDY